MEYLFIGTLINWDYLIDSLNITNLLRYISVWNQSTTEHNKSDPNPLFESQFHLVSLCPSMISSQPWKKTTFPKSFVSSPNL